MNARNAIAIAVAASLALSGCAALAPEREPAASPTAPTAPTARDDAMRLHAESDYGGAAAAWLRVLAADPSSAEAHNGLGAAYAAAGRFADALPAFRRAVHLAPDRAHLHANLGRAHLMLGQPDLARDALERAARMDPGDVQTQRSLASAYRVLLDSARADLARARSQARAAAPAPHVAGVHKGDMVLSVLQPNVFELRRPQISPTLPPARRVGEPRRFVVEVSNQKGVPYLATRVARALRARGYTVGRLVKARNAASAESRIEYRPGYRAEAEVLAASLSRPMSLREAGGLSRGIDVRVVLGADAPHPSTLLKPAGPAATETLAAVPGR